MLRLFDSLCVRLAVDESQRICRDNFGIQLFAVRIVEKLFQPLVRANPKMIVAVNADLQVVFQLALVEMLAALFAAHEDILSPDDAVGLAHRLDLAFLLTKPGHKESETLPYSLPDHTNEVGRKG